MNNLSRKLVSLSLATVFAVSLFAGCGSKETTTTGSTSTVSTTTASTSTVSTAQVKKEPLKIKLMNRLGQDFKLTDNPVLAEIEKKANVIFTIDAPPISNYEERQQITVASGDLPDLMYVWNLTANYEKWAAEGIIIPLDDKVKNMPNASKAITQGMWDFCKVPGAANKIYAIPRSMAANNYGMVIKNDWVTNLGAKVPTTVDEFYELAKAFATKDPDKNGKNDTYGFSFTGSPASNLGGTPGVPYLMSAFDVPCTIQNKIALDATDNKYKARESFPGYIPYLQFLNKCFAEKLIDPEFMTDKIYGERPKLAAGKIGMMFGKAQEWDQDGANPATTVDSYTYVNPLKNSKGVSRYDAEPSVWGGYTITKSAKEVDRIIAFLDWAYEWENMKLMNFGIPNVSYASYDEKTKLRVVTPEQAKANVGLFSAYFAIGGSLDGSPISYSSVRAGGVEKTIKLVADFKANVKAIPVNPYKSAKLTEFESKYPDIIKKRDTMEVGVVAGSVSFADYQTFLNNEFLPKIADAVKEVNDLAAKK